MPRHAGVSEDLAKLDTERPNRKTENLSSLTARMIMEIINDEDSRVAPAVRKAIPRITMAAEIAARTFLSGGRIFYVGAGTSGRIAFIDASELKPTFGIGHNRFVVIMAGGRRAMTAAVEGAEDDTSVPVKELKSAGLSAADFLIGITASGRTPFVLAALRYATSVGSPTACVTCNSGTEAEKIAKIAIVVSTGPEVITGSTRMKAGTAQKMVLNMISTYVGIRSGRVEGNAMVGMQPTNLKLRERAVRIVCKETSCTEAEARRALESTGYRIDRAIAAVIGRAGTSKSSF
ncbi:MAG: N-acetylmuramic acid 6-phosphate etherase [Thermoplasmata archaeon]|uniref:N-acetylmuramic acid 6-phosphate etherase n=1 Tax=Candidatus Sysuiplasma superficiale TaxID=2823368 RepID=A0A8J8CI78_9ARCH|nr:N-acetylmuramic acid 6-phosphate etherase [Candidatus Sysuiplasma superficiale]